MENYLLIGNGLNRCLPDGVSWGNLLKNISDEFNVSYNPEIAMPLEFERIINEYLKRESGLQNPGAVINEAKKNIAQSIKSFSLPNNAIHYSLADLNINGFLTTNYDWLLEQVFNRKYSYTGSNNNKYLFQATDMLNKRLITKSWGILLFPPHPHVTN